jgi:NADPH:quinone reductase-like Zn-dependent oxidoreductase
VPQAGGLAVMALRCAGPLRAGDRVLVNGAGGGVGTFAVQIAKSFGCEVTGVDIGRKLDGVRAIGADHVVDFTKEDFADRGQTYDLIVDVASHRSIARYRRSLRPGGTCAIIGGSIPRLLLVMATGPVVSSFASRKVRVPLWKPNNVSDVTFLSRLLENGSVVPLVDRVFPLDETADAFRYYAGQHHTGKIVLTA